MKKTHVFWSNMGLMWYAHHTGIATRMGLKKPSENGLMTIP
jgi:hypothetical protein